MRGATLFSGIGAPECAMPHWSWAWHAEIEKFPSAVLAQRHPESVNLGDVNAEDFVERAAKIGRPDVLVFGSPCQDFSVAGQRVGLDGDRGNLALVALGIAAKLRPRWLVFENVPGLLSSCSGSAEAERSLRDRGLSGNAGVGDHADAEEDSDFAAFLALVQQCGYLGCYRITDAQFAGVPQRRRRIFFVGYLGDWRPAAAVLLEPESMRGDHPPSRETRERIAPTISARPTGGGGLGTDFDLDGGLVESSVEPIAFVQNSRDEVREFGGDGRTCGAIAAEPGMKQQTYIAFTSKDYGGVATVDQSPTLRAMEFDESHANGGGQVAVAYAIGSHAGAADGDQTNRSHAKGGPVGSNIMEEQAYSLRGGRTQAVAMAIPILEAGARTGKSTTDVRAGLGVAEDGDPMFTLQSGKQHAVAFNVLGRAGGATPEVFKPSHFTRGKDGQPSGGETPLGAEPDKGDQEAVLFTGTAVRRLTPRECERLQAFEDDYTLVNYRGKPAADGPRYKALGNAMNVNEIRWVLSRIELFESTMGNGDA